MRRPRHGRTGRTGLTVASTTAIALFGLLASPAADGTTQRAGAAVLRASGSPAPSTTGPGSAEVLPVTVVSPRASSLRFIYTPSGPMTAGAVTIGVPRGWTAPTLTNTTASTGTVSIVGTTIKVSGVTLSGSQLTVTYGAGGRTVTPTSTGGYDTFTVSASPTASGTPSAISSSPTVFVYEKAPPAVFKDLTTVPLAVFNKIGVTSHHVAVSPPTVDRHQPAFTSRVNGRKVPASFYWGAEYCPFCAATRWGVIVALARFGHFNQLYEMSSSPTDYAPNTPSFTFHLSSYSSPYLTFTGYEVEGPFGQLLARTPRAIQALVQKYNAMQSFPFMDVANLTFITQSAFDPLALAGRDRNEIANHLKVPSNPDTQAIIATANYLTAGICASDGEKPASVCKTAGVLVADRALHLPRP